MTRLIDLPPDPAKRLAGLECPNFATRPCVTGPVLSIPPAVAFGVLVRGGAPTDRSGTAMAAGLLSATWGAFVFVFAGPSDDPPLHCSVVHGRLLDCDDRGMGRSAPPVAMVRKDRRSGGFEANESRQCVT